MPPTPGRVRRPHSDTSSMRERQLPMVVRMLPRTGVTRPLPSLVGKDGNGAASRRKTSQSRLVTLWWAVFASVGQPTASSARLLGADVNRAGPHASLGRTGLRVNSARIWCVPTRGSSRRFDFPRPARGGCGRCQSAAHGQDRPRCPTTMAPRRHMCPFSRPRMLVRRLQS
jgi:hypothetical protein